MIKLTLLKDHILVYDVEDWISLRKKHRIVGNIIGNTQFIPSLPTKLLPEEALLLLNKNLAALYEYEDVSEPSTDQSLQAKFEETVLYVQQEEYKEHRKLQIGSIIDTIFEKKRAAGDKRTKDEMLKNMVDSSSSINKNNMLWPIFLKDNTSVSKLISKETILPLTTPLRTAVFQDLWEKGYFITNGEKFGGDFLVYFGDPVVHHAIFIVRCIELETTFLPKELVAFGRLGVSVKKRAVFASIKNSNISYITLNWIDA
ncbi:uncharacterized protein LOC126744896 [Anthonomus grandis grandis]|uniref:uncharacterized protein LOC126744896 n=1 Tax=Anthonomus grandis grandis TaxID=2921223 RepID=UPI002165C41A|nr:uncharacterized protein LOC126744896 [Anthonomus grandis grandis]